MRSWSTPVLCSAGSWVDKLWRSVHQLRKVATQSDASRCSLEVGRLPGWRAGYGLSNWMNELTDWLLSSSWLRKSRVRMIHSKAESL